MRVSDRVFVVTGGGNGLGRALVLDLLARGARVAAVDISQRALEETAALSGASRDRLSTHGADLTVLESVEALPDQVISQHGAVDCVINCAGIIHPFLDVSETSFDVVRKVFNVNFYGVLYMTKTFLPYLSGREEAYVVNVSSSGALSPVPGETAYGASKAAVRILTEGLRLELGSTRIRVMTVFPGGISTNIIDDSGVATDLRVAELRKKLSFVLLTPQRAAKVIIRGIERNRSRLTPGIDAALMDVFSRLFPRLGPRLTYRIIDAVLQQ